MISAVQKTLTGEQIEILRAVLYFDVFKYPLTRNELYENSAISISKKEFEVELSYLLDSGFLKELNGFVLSVERDEQDISKRLKGNAGAQEMMPIALKYSKIVASFPFVDAVLLSGALSKNYYDENGDIDFFIVTKPNRLWICRTLLILRFKMLPKHKKRFWCTNYFISSDKMEIPDVNVFTGTELAYLIPTVNYSIYKNLVEKNSWYKSRFPNKNIAGNTQCIEPPRPFFKRLTEFLMFGLPGTLLDDVLLYVTLKHWQKKYPELASEDFELQFRSRKNVCKRHTKGFQNRVLKMWEEKQSDFEKLFNTSLR